VDIRTLNTAWDSAYGGWDEIPPGEGSRKSSQADFHLFRASTLGSWAEFLRKAVDAGHPGAAYIWRSPPSRKPSDRHLPGAPAFARFRMSALLRAHESDSDLVQSACVDLLVVP